MAVYKIDTHPEPRKPTPTPAKRRSPAMMWSIGSAAVVILGIGGYVLARHFRTPAPDAPPAQIVKYMASEQFAALSADDKKKYEESIRALPRDEMRKAFEEAKLTDEEQSRQRQNWMTNSPQAKQQEAYFALQTQAERDAFLDKMIDEGEARRAQWEARAATQPAGQNGGGRRGGGNGANNPPGRGGDGRGGNFDPAKMKTMMESIPPEQRARWSEFRNAMRARRQARGMANRN